MERVLPSLLDRLVDFENSAVPGTGSGLGVVDAGWKFSDFRETVLRDLGWIFNSSAPAALMDFDLAARYPYAAKSLLNYGLRDIFGRDVVDLDLIHKRVHDAISYFEPRLEVEQQKLSVSKEGQLVEIVIEGRLLTRSSTGRVLVRTDLETLSSSLRLESYG